MTSSVWVTIGVFALTIAFNAGIAWALIRLASRKAEAVATAVGRLDHTVGVLDKTIAGLDERMDARHEENLRRFERLEAERR